MKLLVIGAIVLLATAVYADHQKEKHHPKPSKPSTILGPATAPHSKHVPKSHSFVRHTRKLRLSQPPKPKLKPSPRKASPRQSIQWQKPKGHLRNAPLRKFPRNLPILKSRQATSTHRQVRPALRPGNKRPAVKLPAFQNRPIQPIPPLRPAQVGPVENNPRFRRLVTNLKQSASHLRQGLQRGNSNLRQSFRTLGARNPLQFRRPFGKPENQNRRKFRLPAIVYKRAEDMPGYEKFTLAEVVYPEKESEISKRVDNEEDIKFVDTPLDIDPRTKNKKPEQNSKEIVAVKEVKKNDKISPDEFGL